MFIGHQSIVSRFSARLPNLLQGHAFLFAGPEYVGKKTFARMFAESYTARKERVCEVSGASRGDVLILEPKVFEKKGIKKKREVSVGEARKKIAELSLSSRSYGRRVLIIDNAHMLTNAAQNALLKTIEEPDPQKLVVLITHELDRILPTIQSRAQRVAFHPVPFEECMDIFSQYTQREARERYLLACGAPGRVVGMMQDKALFDHVKKNKALFFDLASMNRSEKMRLGEKLSQNVDTAIETLTLWMHLFREMAILNTLPKRVAYANAERLDQTIRILRHTNAHPRLILENSALALEHNV